MITPTTYSGLLPFRNGPVYRADGPTPMIKYLVEQGYLNPVETDVLPELTLRHVRWEITIPGQIALEELEQEEEQLRQQKADKHTDRRFQIFYILLGALLTLLIEHGAKIFDYLNAALG